MAGLAMTMGLSACSTPHLGGLQDSNSALNADRAASGPTIEDMVDHIQCEVAKAVDAASTSEDSIPKLVDANDADHPVATVGKYFRSHGYVAQVSLTADVIDVQSVNPGLNFIKPYTTSTNFTMAFAGQYSQTRHRSFNYYFPVDVRPIFMVKDEKGQTLKEPRLAPLAPRYCVGDQASKKKGFEGDLGIDTELYTGLRANYATRGKTIDATSSANLAKQLNLSFTTQIDFQILWSGGIGPNWTLTNFKGPTGGGAGAGGGGGGGGSSGGGGGGGSQLLNTSNTGKDTVIIAFAPVGTEKRSVAHANLQRDADAADAAARASKAAETSTDRRIASLMSSFEAT